VNTSISQYAFNICESMLVIRLWVRLVMSPFAAARTCWQKIVDEGGLFNKVNPLCKEERREEAGRRERSEKETGWLVSYFSWLETIRLVRHAPTPQPAAPSPMIFQRYAYQPRMTIPHDQIRGIQACMLAEYTSTPVGKDLSISNGVGIAPLCLEACTLAEQASEHHVHAIAEVCVSIIHMHT